MSIIYDRINRRLSKVLDVSILCARGRNLIWGETALLVKRRKDVMRISKQERLYLILFLECDDELNEQFHPRQIFLPLA